MAFLTRPQRREAEAIARIGYCNPFLPERLELERAVIGDRFQSAARVIHFPTDRQAQAIFGNFGLLREKAKKLAEHMRSHVLSAGFPRQEDQELYRETVLFVLYGEHFSLAESEATLRLADRLDEPVKIWKDFVRDYQRYFNLPGLVLPSYVDASHCFSIFYQIDRAFGHIFRWIIGSSMPIANLRAAIWESIFTHDMARYVRGIHPSIADITTLIIGKSGTGKELVAQAIGLSRYRPFNTKTMKFDDNQCQPMFPVNLSALSPTLIESELFGHCKGSFTGAVGDRVGWLEACGPAGTVFLDEIGEIELAIQVKLLRVLQTRCFSRVGETKQREFLGKFIAATNRDLAEEIEFGTFREDLYYRLCADIIRTPTLREQLADCPADLSELTRFIARQLLPALPEEAERLVSETVHWIETHFGAEYEWPGNIRELEQCVRNVLIRKSYVPPNSPNRGSQFATSKSVGLPPKPLDNEAFLHALMAGELSLEEVETHYASLVYARLGRLDLTAKRLGVDWRTVRKKVRNHRSQ